MRWDDVFKWFGGVLTTQQGHKPGNDQPPPKGPTITPPLERQRIEARANLIEERLKAELGRRTT